MTNVVWVALVYAALLTVGLRTIRKEGRARDGVLYVAIIGWCAYMSAAKHWQLPSGSIIQLHSWTFFSLGKWISNLLGGLPM